ncbi:MAG TPA: bifunctional oligoribonuclease/PAP phosphatase NrnA [Spirochaetia bacterium]|nr:bifunctional oligoribonuclease/PAP phosphatase NrnA [Spirochaetia bacterium]
MSSKTEAVQFLKTHDSFLILGHKEPDGDCVASQITMASIVSGLGKKASLHSVGPFDRPEIEGFAEQFTGSIPSEKLSGAAVIIVDCSTPDRTGSLGSAVEGLPTLVIDHHSAGETFGTVRYVDDACPSTTFLVFSLFEELKIPVDPGTARLLLFGFCTDTGFFRHLGRGSPETFQTLSRISACGTSPQEVYMMIYGRRELSGRKLLADLLLRVESYKEGRLLVSWQTTEDRKRHGALQRGEDELYRLLQTVRGAVVIAFIKEEREGGYSVGLRSNSPVDVGKVAAGFGGGGHRQAAGFDIKGSLESVKDVVVKTVSSILG